MSVSRESQAIIRVEAEQAGGLEACGLVVFGADGEQVIVARNVSSDPEHNFELDRETMARVFRDDGQILAVWHSHPNGGGPSPADRAACDALGLPYLVYSVSEQRFHALVPRPKWTRVLDHHHDYCLAIIEDYFREVLGVRIEIPRLDSFEDWPHLGYDPIHALASDLGFVEVDGEPEPSDVLSFTTASKLPNMLAIVVEPGRLMLVSMSDGKRKMICPSTGAKPIVKDLTPSLRRCIAHHYRYAGAR